MKILLISYNKEDIPIAVKPLGLAYIADALMKNNHDVNMLDLRFKTNSDDEIKNAIDSFLPDMIGISIRNIDSGCFLEPNFYIPQAKKLLTLVSKLAADIPIVLGGAGFSLMSREIFQYCNEADFGIVGEGELAFIKLLEVLEHRASLEEVPALLYWEKGNMVLNSPKYSKSIERVDLRNFFDENYYSSSFGSKTNRINSEGILTKRGCIFKCNFCGTPDFDGRNIRCYDVNVIVDNMEKIKNNSTDEVIFEVVDNIINYPLHHLEAFCKEIIRRKCNFKWTCIATPELLDGKIIEMMKKAGCINIEFGIESFSDKILKNFSKSFTKNDAEKAFALCREFEIKALCDIMLGGPGENYDTISETFESIEKVNPSFVLFNYGIRIFPGTGLYDIAKKENQISESDILLVPKFYISKQINNQALEYIENKLRRNPGKYYLCHEIFQHKMQNCIDKAIQTWKNIESDVYYSAE